LESVNGGLHNIDIALGDARSRFLECAAGRPACYATSDLMVTTVMLSLEAEGNVEIALRLYAMDSMFPHGGTLYTKLWHRNRPTVQGDKDALDLAKSFTLPAGLDEYSESGISRLRTALNHLFGSVSQVCNSVSSDFTLLTHRQGAVLTRV